MPREGLKGRLKDLIYGRRQQTETEVVYEPSMNVFTFHTYLELLEEHNEEKEKEMKKQKMKRNMRGKGLGGGI